MFKKLQRKKIQKRIERALGKRDRFGVNNKVKTIGVVFNGDEIKDLSFFNSMISSFKISEEKISFLGLVTFDKKQPSLPKHLYTKKNFSWSGELKGEALNKFVASDFDVLVAYYNNENLYLDLIVAESNARFKVGCVDSDERLFDLILAEKTKNRVGFNAELIKYLKILGKL